MDREYFEKDFDLFINNLFNENKSSLPSDSGNMKNNAYKIKRTKTGWDIYIDDSVAPYAKWLEENPNKKQGFWSDYSKQIIDKIKQKYGGQ